MKYSINKIIGTPIQEFINKDKNGIKYQKANLIPFYKPNDEMALTSVFLSSLRLINEFKNEFFSEVQLPQGGTLYTFTEVVFPQYSDCRIDGLILVVKSNTIRDAAILEMKNKENIIELKQMEKYIEIAKDLCIPNIITVSNQFVAEPSQSPLNISTSKGIKLYHFSWSYLLTIAQILLFDNDKNIEDEDQVAIMREVVNYLDNDISGVRGFTKMKKGWKEVVSQINRGVSLNVTNSIVKETISSWLQEEKDMALILSRELGVLVKSGNRKFKGQLHKRIEHNSEKLIKQKELLSKLKVEGAVSDIKIRALFDKRIIEMAVTLNPPLDRGLKAQIGWLERQIKKCSNKEPELFAKLHKEIVIDINIKYARDNIRIPFNRIDELYAQIKDKEINEFTIIRVKDFGKYFSSTKKFVEMIETMLVEFYGGIVQYLVKWEKSAPKISKSKLNRPNESSKKEILSDTKKDDNHSENIKNGSNNENKDSSIDYNEFYRSNNLTKTEETDFED